MMMKMEKSSEQNHHQNSLASEPMEFILTEIVLLQYVGCSSLDELQRDRAALKAKRINLNTKKKKKNCEWMRCE